MKDSSQSLRAWLYARIPYDFVGTQRQLDFLRLRASLDNTEIVGSSSDIHEGILHRSGYRKMMRQVKSGNVDVIYISHVGAISHQDRLLTKFFKQLTVRGVSIKATDESIAWHAELYRYGRRVRQFAARKKLPIPW